MNEDRNSFDVVIVGEGLLDLTLRWYLGEPKTGTCD